MSQAFRIGIDARFFGLASAGLARYNRELIKHLLKAERPYKYVVFVRPDDAGDPLLQHPDVEIRVSTIPHYTLREQLRFGAELRAAHLDLMHFTNFNWPLGYRGPFLFTIHDLTLLQFAGRSPVSKLKIRPLRLAMQQGVKRSEVVITVSEYQRGLIAQTFGTSQDKIVVTHNGIDQAFKPLPPAEVETFRKRHGLPGRYIMYTGQWRQHKNLLRLLKAFDQVHHHDPKLKLVLIGKVDEAFPIIPRTIRELGLEREVIMTGFVEDVDLPYYYNAATVFAFPSLSEGFGIPPVEALACGTPVASSNAAPMPEILAQAAAYFDPHDTKDVATVISRLLTDQNLRQDCIKRGLVQASRYSWEHTAETILKTYDQVLAQ